jgi:signal transduction histidine kinase
MNARPIHAVAQLEPALVEALGRRVEVPLLVLRVPELAQRAWRDGRPAALRLERETAVAFARAAERIVREGDALAHEPASDWFAVAMLAPARDGRVSLLDARSALERIAATMSLLCGMRMETGWWPIAGRDDVAGFGKTIERALERGARERERFEFLATVGHELRTPLTSIRGYVETVLDEELDAVTRQRFLQVVRNEALRLGRLVNGMLDFSPLDLSVPHAPGNAELGAAVRAAIEALEPIAREAGVALRMPHAGEHVARIGVDACMHVLLNVIENAIKYGRAGGQVLISFERRGPFVRVIVDDDGPGVPAEDRERIFEHRMRGCSAHETTGSGIGLALVRTIVERASGSVSAHDSPMGGARFVIRLPSAQAELRDVTS